jgi:hypothetical protein
MTDHSPHQPDDLLDRALASYTPRTPPLGLEQRLLARMAAGGAHQPRLHPALWWACSAAAIVVLSLAITAIHLHRQTPAQSKLHTVPASSPATAGAESDAQDAHVPPLASVAPTGARTRARRTRLIDPADSVSFQEMRAASHPAPEAPLTEEERLLLRIVHTQEPQQLAMLNPEIRAKKDAESEAEFQDFVEKSIQGDRE